MIGRLALAWALLGTSVSAQVVSPMNGVALGEPPESGFEFLVAGHLYGDPLRHSVHPAASIQSAVPLLLARKPALIVLVGDLVWQPDAAHFEGLRRGFVDRVDVPLFNAAGNHELADRAAYEAEFGATHATFEVGPALFVLLDSERPPAEEAAYLREALARLEAGDHLRHVFVFSHRLLWAPGRNELQAVTDRINNLDGYDMESSLARDVEPDLARVAKVRDVVWFSGDVGVRGPTLFRHRDESTGIVYAATGVGGRPDDAVISVRVRPGVAPELVGIDLAGGTELSLDDYGVARWAAEGETGRGLLDRARRGLGRGTFWIGAAGGGLVGLFVGLRLARRRRTGAS